LKGERGLIGPFLPYQCPTPQATSPGAVLRDTSGGTSYHRVRLAFDSKPQVRGPNCTSGPLFGPRPGFPPASPCPGLDRPVSSLTGVATGPFGPRPSPELTPAAGARFPYASGLSALRLATPVNSPARVSRRSGRPWDCPRAAPFGALTGISLSGRPRLLPAGFRRFSPPSRGTFHLSLTLLVRYRSWDVFSLGGQWPPTSRTISEVRYSGIRGITHPPFAYGAITLFGPPFQGSSARASGWTPGP
jgi:hypothetical protein